MHDSQSNWCRSIKQLFPNQFQNVSVLDAGAYDINGNNRYLFENYTYVGIDVHEGNNVDIICPIHELEITTQFDVVITTNMLEHDMHWKKSIAKLISLTKPNGLLMMQSFIGVEHGTNSHCKHDSLTTKLDNDAWNNHYYCVMPKDIMTHFDIYEEFQYFSIGIQPNSPNEDFIFWGIKR